MDDETHNELVRLGSSALAIETVLFAFLSEVQRSKLLTDQALARLFDQAEDTLTMGAYKIGPKAPAEYFSRALKVVTEIRTELGLPEE